jgi:hypothetical protein
LIQAVRGNANKHFARMQTPVADDAVERKEGKFNTRGEPKLSAQVLRMPSVTKADGHGGPGRSDSREGGDNLRTSIGGSLNPEWVEWFMGWPIGWTALQPLETAKFRQWSSSHGKFSIRNLKSSILK